jgi:hypothetical protein
VDGTDPVGVDAEAVGAAARLATMEDTFLGDREKAWMGLDPGERARWLVAAWTAKEAYLKMRGAGFAAAGGFRVLRQMELLPTNDRRGWRTFLLHDRGTAVDARVWVASVGNYVVAISTALPLVLADGSGDPPSVEGVDLS